MADLIEIKDGLTNLYNEKYLQQDFYNRIAKTQKTRIIMFDLQGFKMINDTYGHEIGDKCLRSFAKALNLAFNDKEKSTVSRFHGDEFCVLTTLSEAAIKENLRRLNLFLEFLYQSEITPCEIKYNAGDCPFITSYAQSKKIADYMMYEAKRLKIPYMPYDIEIWNNRVHLKELATRVEKCAEDKSFVYVQRDVFDKEREKAGIIQLYTRDEKGNSILGLNSSGLNNMTVQKMDMVNIKELIKGNTKEKRIVIIDPNSLLKEKVIKQILSELTIEERNNIIFAIDFRRIDPRTKTRIFDIINGLRLFGVQILVDKFDTSISDSTLLDVGFDYLRVNPEYWKSAIKDPKTLQLLKSKIDLLEFFDGGKKVLFDIIESEKELAFVRNLTNGNALLAGNALEKEKQYALK